MNQLCWLCASACEFNSLKNVFLMRFSSLHKYSKIFARKILKLLLFTIHCNQLELWGGVSAFSLPFGMFPLAAFCFRCSLIRLKISMTNGWLNFPSIASKNSWWLFGQSSRFSYSNACMTKSKRSKSLTNFDSGVCPSSYSCLDYRYQLALFAWNLICARNSIALHRNSLRLNSLQIVS